MTFLVKMMMLMPFMMMILRLIPSRRRKSTIIKVWWRPDNQSLSNEKLSCVSVLLEILLISNSTWRTLEMVHVSKIGGVPTTAVGTKNGSRLIVPRRKHLLIAKYGNMTPSSVQWKYHWKTFWGTFLCGKNTFSSYVCIFSHFLSCFPNISD